MDKTTKWLLIGGLIFLFAMSVNGVQNRQTYAEAGDHALRTEFRGTCKEFRQRMGPGPYSGSFAQQVDANCRYLGE